MLKKVDQQGRSRWKHRRRSIFHPPTPSCQDSLLLRVGYVEDAFEARTKLTDFFSILPASVFVSDQ
jgi:hypothetical protein